MPLKLGLCGLYFHINAVLELDRKEVELAGIADQTHSQDSPFFNPHVTPRQLADERCVPLFDNYLELFDKVDPDIVAVYCVDSEKSKVIVEALKRNKHVVSDKPLCITLNQLDEIQAALASTRGSLALLLPLAYNGIYKTIKEIVAGGEIGEVLSVRSRRAYIQKVSARPKWFFTKEYGGGILCDIGTHEYDLVRHLTGKDAEEVTAYAANGKIRQFETGEDYAHALFKMTGNLFYSLHIDRISALNSVGDQSSMEIIGAKGQIVVPIGSDRIIVTAESHKASVQHADFPTVDIYEALMKDYLCSLKAGDYAKRFFAPQVFASVRSVLSAQLSADNAGEKTRI